MDSRTSPSPEPDAPDVTVIHDSTARAVHAQPGIAVTLTCAVPPLAPISTRSASNWNLQGTPSCVSSTRTPSTTSVPRRELAMAFAATCTDRFASPCPLVRSSPIQAASEVTLHVQSRAAVMATVPDPPDEGNDPGEAAADTAHRAAAGEVGAAGEVSSVEVEPHAEAIRVDMATRRRADRTTRYQQRGCHGEPGRARGLQRFERVVEVHDPALPA
jgi:hypothetical protein